MHRHILHFTFYILHLSISAFAQTDPLERKFIAKGLVDVQKIDPSITVDLKYSTTDNFIKTDVYGNLTRAYLQPMAAQKVAKANELLHKANPDYHLLIYDAARPMSVTVIFWNKMSHLPPHLREDFVADPKQGSIHNFGCAVDLTIADKNGKALDMGTPYDYYGDLAWPTKEQYLLKVGKLTQAQINNRKLLRRVMVEAGYTSIVSFNAMPRKKAKARYGFIE
jgi:D-alanyl-D-alanine dipeptidase